MIAHFAAHVEPSDEEPCENGWLPRNPVAAWQNEAKQDVQEKHAVPV